VSSVDRDPPPVEREWLHAGTVARPHGLDGSFHVADARPRLLVLGGVVLVEGRPRTIERRAGHDHGVIVRIEGCADRAAAEALRGAQLLVAREGAPELEEDEWWAEELEGCAVADAGRPVGVVRRLVEMPSCELLEVELDGGGELLVPLVGDAVRSVDVERRVIDVDLTFLDVDLTRSDADLTRSDADLTRSDADLTRSDADLTRSDADLPHRDVEVPPAAGEE
jgi:16S rRNA processing protein RimM